jgi:hypothetical protein
MASKTFVDQQKWDLFKLVKVSQTPSYQRQSYDPTAFVIKLHAHDTEYPPNYSTFCVSCYCVRKPSYYYLNAYFLILLITITSLTIFSVSYKLPQSRLQTMFTLLLSSVR